jgi:hypothetical protein
MLAPEHPVHPSAIDIEQLDPRSLIIVRCQ